MRDEQLEGESSTDPIFNCESEWMTLDVVRIDWHSETCRNLNTGIESTSSEIFEQVPRPSLDHCDI